MSKNKLLSALTVQPWQIQLDQLRLPWRIEQVVEWGIMVLIMVKGFLERVGWGGGKRICLETLAHQQINTTTLLREVRCSTVPKDTRAHKSTQQPYATLASVASMAGNTLLWNLTELEKQDRGGLWKRCNSSKSIHLLTCSITHTQTCAKTRWNCIQPASRYT